MESPNNLHQFLSQLPGKSPELVVRQLGELDVVDAVRRLSSQPKTLRALAANSYWHSNGFCKILLLRNENGSLRLHLWPQPVMTTVHSHRWSLFSRVLRGCVVNTSYSLSRIKSDPCYDVYNYLSSGCDELFLRSGGVRLKVAEIVQLAEGSTYLVPWKSIHRSETLGMTATLVLTGRDQEETTRIFVPEGNTYLADGYRRVPMKPNELISLLSEYFS